MEIKRCNALRLTALCSHPGNFMDTRAGGIARNADAITKGLESVRGPTRLIMELTAGQGTVIGSTFEEIAELIERTPPRFASAWASVSTLRTSLLRDPTS